MSIRSAIIGITSLLLMLAIGVIALIGVRTIGRSVVREAQSRVDHDLSTLVALYENDLRLRSERVRFSVERVLTDPAKGGDRRALLDEVRGGLGIAVLNWCGPDGETIAGSFGDGARRVPVERDPVIRAALRGETAAGTVLLDRARLELEGGAALARSQVVGGSTGAPVEDALFQWFAVPLREPGGRVTGVIYGGQPLNLNTALVDSFAEVLFGNALYGGKPVGTVTVFLGDTRVATNVRDRAGRRAFGTQVSDVVRRRVLEQGERWRDRAWVVDAWYISGYEPLRDPDGQTLGMLYVGLLEAPYLAQQRQLVVGFAVPAMLLLALGLAATILVVRRITRPLERLEESASRIADGHWDSPVAAGGSYKEIAELSATLHRMQDAIARRDADLRGSNRELADANRELARVNENYMNTLGFVTHELKGPLANIQSLIELVVDGYVGGMPEQGADLLRRVRRNCEELQDMVKNYLDLSRAERDDLAPSPRPIDFAEDVVAPSTMQAEALFRSRGMSLRVSAPESAPLVGDPDLLRMALSNYLTNAAKYGREGGEATLSVVLREGELTVEVWNEGEGFSAEEQSRLFQKFARLDNATTKTRKGSGLGLYLTARVIAHHGGRTWAESERGSWARFGFRMPVKTVAAGASRASGS